MVVGRSVRMENIWSSGLVESRQVPKRMLETEDGGMRITAVLPVPSSVAPWTSTERAAGRVLDVRPRTERIVRRVQEVKSAWIPPPAW